MLSLTLAAAAAVPATRDPGEEFCREPRTVWCGEAEELRFKDLATNAAPILWFSPDEPLLRGTRTRLGDPDRWALDVGYTPSISRVIDWYVAAGARWDRAASGWDASFEGEAGLQARWNLLGFRLGVRARVSDFSISNERLVVKVGLGPFPGGSVRGRE